MIKKTMRLVGIIGVALSLCACEVSYKAQDDAMYYADRGIEQYKKIEHFARSKFDKNYDPRGDNLSLHLSNFDTFICDGARQLIANFDRDENTVSLAFERKNKFLIRTSPAYPFTDGIYDLFIMEDGTLLLEKDGAAIFRHCRPLVHDARSSKPYLYTPTMTPVEYRSAEPSFEKKMAK